MPLRFDCFFALLALLFFASTEGILRAQSSAGDVESQSARVAASQDAILFSEDAFDGVNRSNGGGQTFLVGSLQGFFRRTLIDFDLEGHVPTGAVVVNARLVLQVVNANSQPFLGIFRVPGRWKQGSSTPEVDEFAGGEAMTGDVTWLYRSYHETDEAQRVAWEFPGGDFNFERPLLWEAGTTGEENAVSFTSDEFITDVQSMVSLPEQHSGWFLLGEETTLGTVYQQYGSSENDSEALQPYLEIEFTEAPDVAKVVRNYDALVTLAGTGNNEERDNDWKPKFEGGPALDAELSRPSIARAVADGTVYFTDTYGHAIRKINVDGTIETVAGSGQEGFNGEDGLATEIQLDQPNGLFVLPNGNIYILDVDNNRIRKVTLDGMITTVIHDDAPDGGIPTGRGLWVSEDEQTIYYAARQVLKRWTAEAGEIEVIASGFDRLGNIDLDPASGDFLVVDTDDDAVWRVAADGSSKSKIAGGGNKTTTGHPAKDMRLDGVRGIAAAGHGGYFLTTQKDGDILYVDLDAIAHILIPGSEGGNIIGGEGETLSDIFSLGGNRVSQPYAITIAPNGDLVITTNDSGLVRVVRKGRTPTIVNSGLDGDDTYSLTWSSQIQRLYLVESTDDMETWSLASEIPSSRNTASFSAGILDPKRFYRVRFYYP